MCPGPTRAFSWPGCHAGCRAVVWGETQLAASGTQFEVTACHNGACNQGTLDATESNSIELSGELHSIAVRARLLPEEEGQWRLLLSFDFPHPTPPGGALSGVYSVTAVDEDTGEVAVTLSRTVLYREFEVCCQTCWGGEFGP